MKTWREWIVTNPSVMMGKPAIVGTRITVELILEKLAAGETVDDLLEAHPRLTGRPFKQHWPLRLRHCELTWCIP